MEKKKIKRSSKKASMSIGKESVSNGVTPPIVEPVSSGVTPPIVEPVSNGVTPPIVESVSSGVIPPVVEPVSDDERMPALADKLPSKPIDSPDRTEGGVPDERRDNIHYGDDFYEGMSGGYARINVEGQQSAGYAHSVGAEPQRGGNKILWITVIIMSVLCITVGVLAATLTGYFMRKGANPPVIDTTDVRQATAAVIETRKSSIVEVRCQGLSGTGVIIKLSNNRIYIITNAHVINESETATVRFDGDDDFYNAETLGYSTYYDIAVLTVAGYNPPNGVYNLENTEYFDGKVRYVDGDYVVAIGNAMGLGVAAYDGIVSRSSELLVYGDKTVPVLRTTAAINEGMSGCGLFDMSGHLIGIGTYRMTSSVAGSTGHENDVGDTGFAVPVSVAYSVYKHILESANGKEEEHMPRLTFSKPRTSVIGAITFDLGDFGVFTAEFRKSRLTVVSVDANKPPQNIEVGNIIMSVGSESIKADICATCSEFLKYRSGASRGSVMTLTVRRDGNIETVKVDGYYKHVA